MKPMQIHNQHREITTVIHLPAMNELEADGNRQQSSSTNSSLKHMDPVQFLDPLMMMKMDLQDLLWDKPSFQL